MMNTLTEAKVIAMSILGLVSIICGMIPVFISKKLGWTQSSRSSADDSLSPLARAVLSGILCFGGGVLMGTGFLHLLPEVHEKWEKYTEENQIDVNLSLGVVVICAGFFLVYFVEEVVHLVMDRHAHNRADVSLHRAVSIRGCPVSLESQLTEVPADTQTDKGGPSSGAPCQNKSICIQRNCKGEKEYCREATGDIDDRVEKYCCSVQRAVDSDQPKVAIMHSLSASLSDRYGTFRSSQGTAIMAVEADSVLQDGIKTRPYHDTVSSASSLLHHAKGHSHLHGHHHHASVGSSKLNGLFIIIALSLHEILEGMAVGLQNDKAGVVQLSTAVASHKFVISFCVGLELSATGVRRLIHTIYILTFSLVTPIGMGIGIAMTSHLNEGDPDQSLSSLIMQGLACGTILYVAFFEILERERAKSMVGLIQWSLLVLGFLSIMGLQSLAREPADDHGSFQPFNNDSISTFNTFNYSMSV